VLEAKGQLHLGPPINDSTAAASVTGQGPNWAASFLEKLGSPNHRDVTTTIELLRSGIGDRFAQLPEGHLLRQNVSLLGQQGGILGRHNGHGGRYP